MVVWKPGQPARWDIVIFPSPTDLRTNYVQRLVGLPGETVEIAAGDVFINNVRAARPPGVADEMWIPVSDTRCRPARPVAGPDSWTPVGSAADDPNSDWRTDGQGGWSLPDLPAARRLLFAPPITDRLVYNSDQPQGAGTLVSDVRVVLDVSRLSGKGQLSIIWSHAGRGFRASLGRSGGAIIEDRDRQGELKLPPIDWTMPHRIEVMFRDGYAGVVCDGQVLGRMVVGPQDIGWARAREAATESPCELSISAVNCAVELKRIRVDRDVHYTSRIPAMPHLLMRACAGRAMVLGHDEHFMLGDNSTNSSDSRAWNSQDPSLAGKCQLGAVPASLIVGRAVLIYTPLSRARTLP
jgi:signal peptidase I